MTGVGYCRFCNHPIYWVLTVNGDKIPLEPEPSKRGKLRLEPGAEGPITVYVAEADRPKHAGQLYVRHSCVPGEPRRQKRRPEPDPGFRYWGD